MVVIKTYTEMCSLHTTIQSQVWKGSWWSSSPNPNLICKLYLWIFAMCSSNQCIITSNDGRFVSLAFCILLWVFVKIDPFLSFLYFTLWMAQAFSSRKERRTAHQTLSFVVWLRESRHPYINSSPPYNSPHHSVTFIACTALTTTGNYIRGWY